MSHQRRRVELGLDVRGEQFIREHISIRIQEYIAGIASRTEVSVFTQRVQGVNRLYRIKAIFLMRRAFMSFPIGLSIGRYQV